MAILACVSIFLVIGVQQCLSQAPQSIRQHDLTSTALTSSRTSLFHDVTQTTASRRDVQSCQKVPLGPHVGPSSIDPSIAKRDVALLLLVGFAGFSLFIAIGYNAIRKYVFHDEHNLDTVFDAGGRVSLSLTAVTVTSQLLWPADFLQSSILASKSGLGGSLWMSVGVVIDILLFPALSISLKTRAPGAKTFPQIAYARFGKSAHILFCILALTSSLVVVTSMLLAGKSAIEVLCKDVNDEFIFLVLAVLFGSYCMVGGLGTTFYISYFNTALTFLSISVYLLYTSFYPTEDVARYSTIESIYEATSCIKGPDGNLDNSFLTFQTESGLIYGIVLLFMSTSISFTDQANWQSRIAAKPSQGVVGFFMAAYMWFVIPTALSCTACLTYFTLSAENGTHLLTESEIASGYIAPFVMSHLLGDTGGYLLLTMLMMALMSTGSGEVMAVSSIIVYDIYKTYINPFRSGLTPTSCLLCGEEKQLEHTALKTNKIFCQCPSSINCAQCEQDVEYRAQVGVDKVVYKCPTHGPYRRYEDGLIRYKSWCMLSVILLVVPYGILISQTAINLNWATLSTQILTSPFLLPLFLTITWSKATSKGVISGALSGLVVAIAAMLVTASAYQGGLSDFFTNTAQDYSLLTAMVSGSVVSGLVCVAVSMATHTIKREADAEREWAKTMNIDNPISPFRLIYEEELAKVEAGSIITAKTMDSVFKKTRMYAMVGGVGSLVIFLVAMPAVTLSWQVLTFDQFYGWMRTFQIYCFMCTCVVVVMPPFEEGYQIWQRYKRNKERRDGGRHACSSRL